MFKVKFLNFELDPSFFYQWGRLKRREKIVSLFLLASFVFHLLSWLIWLLGVAPYPVAVGLALPNLGPFNFLTNYLWMVILLIILLTNIFLINALYRKDLLAAWLLIGTNLFLQFLALVVVSFLAALNLT